MCARRGGWLLAVDGWRLAAVGCRLLELWSIDNPPGGSDGGGGGGASPWRKQLEAFCLKLRGISTEQTNQAAAVR